MIPKILIIPLIVGFLAQVSKLLWEAPRGRMSWHSLNTYGGMPSTHTAIAISLVTVIGFAEGFMSASFAIAVIVSILVIRDAIGFRRYLGGHSQALNLIVQELPERERSRFRYYREQLGHTPLEAFLGAVLGFSLSAIFYLVIV